MHATRRAHRSRTHATGGALVRMLASLGLLLLALAAWKHYQRPLAPPAIEDPALSVASPGPVSGDAAAGPTTSVAPAPSVAPAAADPWARAPPAAQTAYQCTDGNSHSFQLEPCPAGATTDWSREASADDLALIARVHQAQGIAKQGLERQHAALLERYSQLASQAAQASAQSAGAAPAPTMRPATAVEQRDANCAAAKQYRDAQLAQAGMDRTFDLIRKLDDLVYDACK